MQLCGSSADSLKITVAANTDISDAVITALVARGMLTTRLMSTDADAITMTRAQKTAWHGQ